MGAIVRHDLRDRAPAARRSRARAAVACFVLAVPAVWAPGAAAATAAPSAQGAAPPASARQAATERRPVTVGDLFRLRHVRDPQVAPDGAWVVYTVATLDSAADRRNTDLWMTSWDGRRTVRLTTTSDESEHSPRWSPDGRTIAFLSARGHEKGADQVWLLPRDGGEAERITDLPGGVQDLVWSPDGTRLALVVSDPPPDESADGEGEEGANEERPKPIVIDRFHFKVDGRGYLRSERDRLYLLDLATRRAERVTRDGYDELLPAWSPDGTRLVFVSKRRPEFDRDENWDLYVADARPDAEPRPLTTFPGPDAHPDYGSRPAWSPDGRWIAYVRGGPPDRFFWYTIERLAVVPAEGGAPRVLTESLDRNVSQPRWSPDGSRIYFLLEDDRSTHLASVPVRGGAVRRHVAGKRFLSDYAVGPQGRIAVLASTPDRPAEVFAVEGERLRPLSRQNHDWLAEVRLGEVREIDFPSADGTRIGGFLALPPDYVPGRRYPTLLRLHGGPVYQFSNEFDFQWHLFAAHGYVVVAPNPRGSSGRGEAFQRAIEADWGRLDVQDVLAAVDYAVEQGIADPERLGVGGWSYGGMLTNYVIASDTRFKAAVSGAGIANITAGYGHDQYVREYEAELGRPWERPEVWLRVSFPFFHADRIRTPTLFLCGQEDWNVPLLGSEQMYQALRSLGVPTQLVIYPGEDHSIDRPSFQRDRLERYLAWYDRFLKAEAASSGDGAR